MTFSPRLSLAATAMALALLCLAATSAQAAAPEPLLSVPEDGTPGASAGRLRFPVGIAADPNLPGHVYVLERANQRVSEFTPWGEFVKAWGWGVRTGANELQACTSLSGCQKGKEGPGDGEFTKPEGIAVDGAGQVYVVESSNHRVQKFDPTGGVGEDEAVFVTKFGEAGEGQLTGGDFSYTSRIAACPSTSDLYVAEAGSEAVKRFGSSGTFKEEIKGGDLAGKNIRGLASDSAAPCNLYTALVGESEVWKLEGSGPSWEALGTKFKPEHAAERPSAAAVDASGNVYVGIDTFSEGPLSEPAKVQKYDSKGNCLSCGKEGEGGLPGFDRSPTTQIEDVAASGNACEADDAYTTHFKPTSPEKSFFSAFGDPPDGTVCEPPQVAPQIAAQFARSVETGVAELAAQINPRFWNDTTYQLEYGTAPCQSGGCTSTTPAAPLTTKTLAHPLTTESVFLEGLQEGTTYHYRFIAVSSGGGPVYGTDPDGGEGPEEASFEDGTEASFTTYRKPQVPPCPANAAFRGGPSEALPDCRAYELVSPLDKEGGDIVSLLEQTTTLPAVLSQSAISGDRIAFGSYRSFAGAAAAPFTTQYIAARQAGVGWETHPISPPRGKRLGALITPTFDTEFRAFSPDLCEAWLNSFAEPPLAAGAPAEYTDLYRRSDEECGGPSYEALNTTPPPNLIGGPAANPGLNAELEGRSADGKTAIYLANDRLSEEAAPAPAKCVSEGKDCLTQLYGFREGMQRFLCLLPGGGAYPDTCTAGGSAGAFGVIGGRNRTANLAGAISADGSRVFWTAGASGAGPIYLRQNPFADPSAQLHGSALGSADLIGPATATGNVVVTQATIKKVHLTKGSFAVGQEITSAGGAIPPATTITKVQQPEPGVFTLTISAPATASEPETTLTGLASAIATNASASSGEFSVGQHLAGQGIARGTTITEVSGATLTLSIPATQTKAGASIEAFSPCTEPEKACTVPVSEAAEEAAGSSKSQFVAAAKDGSRVLFTTETPGKDRRLYEVKVGEEGSPTLIAHEVIGFLGVSEDATRVYVASRAALGGANAEGRSAVAGQANLYFEQGGSFHFIGALSGEDLGLLSPIGSAPYLHNSRVSPDGLSAAFTSKAQMTGYDNTDQSSGAADAEVFLYDVAANVGQGKLVCASCNPGGARPRGKVIKEGAAFLPAAAHIPVFENQLYASRVLSDDGNRLFFEAADALVPRDSNGKEDVYQWEAPGSGGCTPSTPTYSPANGGCVELVSSGQSSLDSRFLDASPSGDDVFFTTLSSLLPQDYGLTDVYDARVEGGLPGPASPPAACEGEACQGPYVAPTDPTPASSSFQGAGNVDEAAAKPKCPKGKVKKSGHCVKRNAKHTKRHKRHHRSSPKGRR